MNALKVPLTPPNSSQLDSIHKQLFEDYEKIASLVILFKKWIESESYLPDNIDNGFLENFIRLSRCSLERAKRKFETYIIVRNDLLKSKVELTDYDFEETDLGRIFLVYPDLTPEGHRLLYGRPYERVDTFDMNVGLTYAFDICDILLHADVNAGYIIILDFRSFSLNFMIKLDMNKTKTFFNMMFNVQPARVERMHIINLSAIGKSFMTMLMSLMSDKMKKRVIIHSDEKELLDYISADLLPPELAGNNISMLQMTNNWKEYLVGNEELKQRHQTMALKQPIPKSKAHLDPSSGFGMEGSFRKIQID